jgi:hypothetical protein
MTNPAVAKSWSLRTVQGLPYTIAVLTDASLWLTFGATRVQLNPADFGPAVAEVQATIAQVLATITLCPATQVVGAVTLTCDKHAGHAESFHHQPNGGPYWLADS